MMKKSILSIILLSCIIIECSECTCSTNSSIPLPNKKNIEMYKQKIKRDRLRGKIAKCTILGATALSLPYVLYKLFIEDVSFGSSECLDNQELTNRLVWLEKKYNTYFKTNLFSSEWIKNTGANALGTFVSAGLGYFAWSGVEKVLKKYNCFDNLGCFITNRLDNLEILDDIFCMTDYVDIAYKHGENREREKERCMVQLKGVIFALESIIAFMEYELDYYISKGALLTAQELQMPDQLFMNTYDFCKTMYQELEDYSGEISFADRTQKYIFYVKSVIKAFGFLEARENWV